MWRKISVLVCLLVGWGFLSLACDLPPFDPRGFRCGVDGDCLRGYVCVNKLCELSIPSEFTLEPSEKTDAGEPSEAGEPLPETPKEGPKESLVEPSPEKIAEPSKEPTVEPSPEKTSELTTEPRPEVMMDGGEASTEKRPEAVKDAP